MNTGHATHFLERLDRADPRETELALALYRDSQAVSLLLHYVQAPEQYERVALSLDAGDRGPFIVVERDGSFVTCLGQGMGTDGLYVVSYERLQHYRFKSADFGARLEMAQELSGKAGVDGLLDQLAGKGHAVSREDFRAVSALQPVLKGEFLRILAEMLVAYDDQLRALGRLKSSNRKTEGPLRSLWETYQMIGHLLLLGLMDGRTLMPDNVMEELFQLLFFVYDVGTIHMASRAVWAAARVGKPLVAPCKQAVRTPVTGSMLFFGLSGLAALGLRHRRLRGEVAKLFKVDEAIIRSLPDAPLEHLRDIRVDPYGCCADAVERPDEVSAPALDHLKTVVHDSLGQLAPPPAYRFAAPANVPEDIAVPWALVLPGDIRTDQTLSTWMLCLIPYLARSEAEQFYLPRDLLDCLNWSWHPDLSLHLLNQDRQTNPERKPLARGFKKVGRNEPCPCGSGKKYKKCHGSAASG